MVSMMNLWIIGCIVAAFLVCGVYAVYRAEQQTLRQAAHTIPAKADTAVVLGNAVNRNGRPNPCLRARVEAGVWLYRAGLAEQLLMSGGTDADSANQADAMRTMALALGVPSERIVVERRSVNTYENIVLSLPLLPDADRMILVSDGFHLARARWLAERHWPGRQVDVFAAADCGDEDAAQWRKRLRETLSWIKAMLLHG